MASEPARPGHPALHIDADGVARIRGYRCDKCGGLFAEATIGTVPSVRAV